MRMFSRPFSKEPASPKPASSRSPFDSLFPEASRKQPPGQPSPGDLKEALGFDRNDPNVTVEYMTFGGEHPRDLDAGAPGYRDGKKNQTASEANENLRSCLAYERRCQDEALGFGDTATEVLKPVTEPRAETPAEKWDRQSPAVVGILMEVMSEVSRAVSKHAPMHSPHEGHSVIREEIDELWQHVMTDTGRTALARKEAIQIACTAVRYVLDLDPH